MTEAQKAIDRMEEARAAGDLDGVRTEIKNLIRLSEVTKHKTVKKFLEGDTEEINVEEYKKLKKSDDKRKGYYIYLAKNLGFNLTNSEGSTADEVLKAIVEGVEVGLKAGDASIFELEEVLRDSLIKEEQEDFIWDPAKYKRKVEDVIMREYTEEINKPATPTNSVYEIMEEEKKRDRKLKAMKEVFNKLK